MLERARAACRSCRFTAKTLIPRRIDQIEWFASASELCALMLHLETGQRHFVSVGVNDPEVWVPMYVYLTVPLGIFELLTPR